LISTCLCPSWRLTTRGFAPRIQQHVFELMDSAQEAFDAALADLVESQAAYVEAEERFVYAPDLKAVD